MVAFGELLWLQIMVRPTPSFNYELEAERVMHRQVVTATYETWKIYSGR
jgi:hypothetical protein